VTEKGFASTKTRELGHLTNYIKVGDQITQGFNNARKWKSYAIIIEKTYTKGGKFFLGLTIFSGKYNTCHIVVLRPKINKKLYIR